jgi:hypothetical protein
MKQKAKSNSSKKLELDGLGWNWRFANYAGRSGSVQIRAVHGPARSIRASSRRSKFKKIEPVQPLAPGIGPPRDGTGQAQFSPFFFYKFKEL